MDSFLCTVSPAHFSSTTGRFLSGYRERGFMCSGRFTGDGMLNPGTGSEVAVCASWEHTRMSVCSVHWLRPLLLVSLT